MQVFRVEADGRAVTEGGKKVADTVSADGVYLIVDHDRRIIWLYCGENAPLLLQFKGAYASERMRKAIGKFYRIRRLNIWECGDKELSEIMDAGVGGGSARELEPESKEGENGKNGGDSFRYTVITDVFKGVKPSSVIRTLLKYDNPTGYKRHMVIIGGNVYTEDKKVISFITEDKAEPYLKKVGELPNGFFLAPGTFGCRLTVKNGKLAALELLREDGEIGKPGRVLVPVLPKSIFNKPGDFNVLLNAFGSSGNGDDFAEKDTDNGSMEGN